MQHMKLGLTAALVSALALTACADPVAPVVDMQGPALATGSISILTAGSTFSSGSGNTKYCGFGGANLYGVASSCEAGDPNAVLTSLNPGWSAYTPSGLFTAASWIGPNATSDAYINLPGTYTYQRTFNIPDNTTNLKMNLEVLADNNMTVLVNGTPIGSQPQTDNFFTTPYAFNATSELKIGENTITFIVNNTRVDATPNGSQCPLPPDMYSVVDYDRVACRNPTGFLYSAVVGWDIRPPVVTPVCDFMTFGRLETAVNGQKVVISGNAGGRNADGSIKGEMEISIGGTKYHVHQLDAYGPIAAGTLVSSSYTNSRAFSGLSGANLVELRLWDDGETGKGVDRVSLTINGNLILGGGVGGITLDKGNAQYHPQCRGPKD